LKNRRRLSTKVVTGFLTASLAIGSACIGAETHSVVFTARSEQAIESFQENAPVVRAMVDELVENVTGKSDVASAWRSLVKPGDRVGIKIAAGGGRFFSTHRAVVEAVVAGLAQAGIARNDVIVWDRAGLGAAGFTSSKTGYQVRGIEPSIGYNKKAVVNCPLMGRLIWGDVGFTNNRSASGLLREPEQVSLESHWSNIVSRDVTKIINLPVMINDENCGLAGALYNVTIPNLDNWRRFLRAPSFGNPYLCELYADANVGPKVVLNLMDGLIAQYAGGPELAPDYAFHHRTLYASKDPVALDAVAFRKILQWRSEAKLGTLGDRAGYLEAAQAMEIGNFAPERIEVREQSEAGSQRSAVSYDKIAPLNHAP
jgi:uncharacterized protein (DUF362 family)